MPSGHRVDVVQSDVIANRIRNRCDGADQTESMTCSLAVLEPSDGVGKYTPCSHHKCVGLDGICV